MHTRSRSDPLIPTNPEIERFLFRNRNCYAQWLEEMAHVEIPVVDPPQPQGVPINVVRIPRNRPRDGGGNDNRSMMEILAPHRSQNRSAITPPPIEANSFEIKTGMIQLLQNSGKFGGEMHENPNEHLDKFLMCADTTRINRVPQDVIRLKLFPFSLDGQALEWFHSLEPNSITTWEGLERAFLSYYFPPSKTVMLRNEIISFRQFESEALHEAWGRFRKMLRNCPHHDIPKHTLVSTFYHGLTPNNRAIVDSAAGGDLFRKSASEAYDLINELARKSTQWQSDKFAGPPRNQLFAIEKEAQNSTVIEMAKKLDSLIAHMGENRPTQVLMCTHCGNDHEGGECRAGSPFAGDKEQVSYVGGNQRYNNYNPHNNAYNNFGNQGWRQRAQHPNLSYGNNQNVLKPPPEFANEYKEQGLGNSSYHQGQSSQKQTQDDPVLSILKDISARLSNNEAYCRDLGNQLAQMSREKQERTQGSLPSTTEKNPKIMNRETAHMVTSKEP